MSRATVSGINSHVHSVPAFFGGMRCIFGGGTTDQKTAHMSQFLQLGPLDFEPDLAYVSYFWHRFRQ